MAPSIFFFSVFLQDESFTIIYCCVHYHLFVSEYVQVLKKRWIMSELSLVFMRNTNKSVRRKK